MDKIKELAQLDEAELSKILGLDKQLADARKQLDEMDALEGEARKCALEKVVKMFEPNIYPSEFKWIKEDAISEAKHKEKREAENNDPNSPTNQLKEMGHTEIGED